MHHEKSLVWGLILSGAAVFAAEPAKVTVSAESAKVPVNAESAKVTIGAYDTKSINADVKAAQPISSGMMMADELEKFRQERQLPAYGTPNARGTVYFTGTATVAANVASRDFIKSRSSAYDKAYTDAVAKLVMDRFGKEFTKKVRQEFSDESTDAENAPASL